MSPALERWAEDLDTQRIVEILGRIIQAAEAVASYAQPRLTFEALLLDIYGGLDSPPAYRSTAEISGAVAGAGTRRRRPSESQARATAAD